LLSHACNNTHIFIDGNVANLCLRYGPSQADAQVFKTLSKAPAVETHPSAYRWYKHIASFEGEFTTLPGDPTKEASSYGPETSQVTINPAAAPEKAAEEDDDDVDLFGSDDEEEDAEAVRIREERLAEYRKKKEGKVKPAAKSIVTLDVKPWGKCYSNTMRIRDVILTMSSQMMRPT
jgi:elongation factor 1-beta